MGIYTSTAPLSKGLVQNLRDSFHKEGSKWGCLFDIFMFAGPRALEVLRMKVSQCASPVRTIEKTWTDITCRFMEYKTAVGYEYEAKENLLLYTTKQDRKTRRTKRTPPISPILKQSIERYLNGIERPVNPDDYMFPGRVGHLSYESLDRMLEKHCSKLGIDETVISGQIGWHMIRKSFALALYHHFGSNLNAALKVAKELGHRRVETTYAYIGIKIEDGTEDAIRSGAMYDVGLVDRINGREPALLSWSNLYDVFESSGALDQLMSSWLRTLTNDDADIERTLDWMKNKKQKVEFVW